MEIDKDAALHIQKVRQHPVIQLRCQNLHEADRAQLFAHAEHPAGLELKGAGRDKVLGGQPGGSQPVPRKAERLLLVHPQNVVHDVQALKAVQRRSYNAQPLEVVQEVGFDALQTGLGGAEVVGLNAEREILGLNQAVVAAGKLVLQHTGVLGADAVKFVSAGRDRNAPCKGFLRSREVHKGKLELHGAVKVVQEIAPRFKDGGLVLILRELVVDVLILDRFGVARVGHTANAVRPHTLIRDAVLRRFFFLIRSVRSCDGGFDLFSFGAGQLFLFGQFDTPPGLTGFAAPERHKNCWSYTDAASAAGSTHGRCCG